MANVRFVLLSKPAAAFSVAGKLQGGSGNRGNFICGNIESEGCAAGLLLGITGALIADRYAVCSRSERNFLTLAVDKFNVQGGFLCRIKLVVFNSIAVILTERNGNPLSLAEFNGFSFNAVNLNLDVKALAGLVFKNKFGSC